MNNLDRLLKLKQLNNKGEKPNNDGNMNDVFTLFQPFIDRIKAQAIPTEEELLSLIKPLIPEPIPGEDGHTPTDKEILTIIAPLLEGLKKAVKPTDSQIIDLIRPLIPEPVKPTKKELKDIIKPLIPPPVKGEKGDKPDHKWDDTKLSFEKPNGEWGKAVDLKGPIGETVKTEITRLGGSVSGGKTTIKEDGTTITTAASFLNFGAGITAVANGSGVDVTMDPETQDLQAVTDLGATTTVESTFSGGLITPNLKASSSAGILLESNSGTDVALLGAGGGAGATFYGGVALNTMTQGSLLFAGASGLISQDNANLFYDDTNNRLGIGTTSPTYTLSLGATATTGVQNALNPANFTATYLSHATKGPLFVAEDRRNSSASAGAFVALYSNDGSAMASGDRLGGFFFGGYDGTSTNRNGAGVFAFADGTYSPTSAPTYLTFETAPAGSVTRSERLRVASNGNIGIGTTAPVYGLHMVGDTANSGTFVVERIENTPNPSGFWGLSGRGTKSAITAVQSGDQLFRFIGGGYHSSSATHNSGEMTFVANQNFTASNAGTNFFIALAPNNSNTRVERFRITEAGNVGIGTVTPSGTLDITSSGSATPLVINKASQAGVRERLMTAKVSDNATSQFFINNGSIGDGAFAPVFGGYTESATLWSMGFGGYIPSSADASDSSNFGLLDFLAARTTNASDPLNGTLSNIVNRKIMTVRGPSSTYFTIAGSGNVGIGTVSPDARLHLISTTEQLRTGYDASNYFSTTVSSAGAVTFDAVGASAGFTFSDSVRFNGGTASSDGSAGATGTIDLTSATSITVKNGLITAWA